MNDTTTTRKDETMTTTDRIEYDDPRVAQFVRLWHESGRAAFEEGYHNLDYDSTAYAHTAHNRSKYIALDYGTSGVYLLDKGTGVVWGIKGYGVRHPGKRIGHLNQLIAKWLHSEKVQMVTQ